MKAYQRRWGFHEDDDLPFLEDIKGDFRSDPRAERFRGAYTLASGRHTVAHKADARLPGQLGECLCTYVVRGPERDDKAPQEQPIAWWWIVVCVRSLRPRMNDRRQEMVLIATLLNRTSVRERRIRPPHPMVTTPDSTVDLSHEPEGADIIEEKKCRVCVFPCARGTTRLRVDAIGTRPSSPSAEAFRVHRIS